MKTWFAFGDSITDMGYYIDTVCRDTGLAGKKYGFSGYAYGEDPAGFGSLRDAAAIMFWSETVPDAVTVFGGTNDFGHGGSIEKMREGLGEILEGIKKRWPGACVLVITPLQRNFDTPLSACESAGVGPNQRGLYLIDYVKVIREVCAEHEVPVLDLYSSSGVTMENARKFTIDGLHPTPEYGITLGHQIAKALSSVMSAS